MSEKIINRRQFLGMSGLATTGLALASCSSSESASTEKHFSGINVVFFLGGREGEGFPFVNTIASGARAAAQDLGCTVEYVESDWDQELIVLQFKEAIDNKPDAICVGGMPEDDIMGPLVDEARRKDIIVHTHTNDLPLTRAQYSKDGFGYVGEIPYDSGVLLSQGLIRKFKMGSDDSVLILGASGNTRVRGLIDGFTENNVTIHNREAENVQFTEDELKSILIDFLAENPDTKFIVGSGGIDTVALAKILPSITENSDDIVGAGYDLSPATLEGIRSGYLGIVHDQQPYLQGYLSILQVCLSKKYRFSGLFINIGLGLVDNSNVDAIAALVEQNIR